MFLAANALGQSHLSLGESGLYALLGYAIVFLGLILLMIVVFIIGKIFMARDQRKLKAAPVAVEAAPVEEAPKPVAPGSAGQLKLHDVEPRIAAMLMAIVANQMNKPINELRFISIKEVKE